MGCEVNSSCSSCSVSGCSSRQQEKPDFSEKLNAKSSVKRLIGIVSGKGGVGKSLVTSALAVSSLRRGYRTAILDADITGPSIPKAFGLTGGVYADEDNFMLPATTNTGIKIMSTNLLLSDVSSPVIWRGPVIAQSVKQYWSQTAWGELDYMFVDMPPGTGDVPLTVFQSLPVSGIIIVTSPQELVSMIVSKAVNMAEKMNVPILGIVENMSYFICDSCDKKHYIYGESSIDEIAGKHDLEVLAKIPVQSDISRAVDTGLVEYLEMPWMDAAMDVVEGLLK